MKWPLAYRWQFQIYFTKEKMYFDSNFIEVGAIGNEPRSVQIMAYPEQTTSYCLNK